MIVTLTGTGPDTFERLIRPLDELARRKKWDVFVQLGYTPYEPTYCKFERFVERDRLIGLVSQAELVISHGGFGSIRDALVHKKPVIAIPRREDCDEVQDDHQFELVGALEKQGLVISLEDTSELEAAVEKARTFVPGALEKSRIPELITDYLKSL